MSPQEVHNLPNLVAALQERHGEISRPWALQNKGKRKEEKEDLDFQKGASHDLD